MRYDCNILNCWDRGGKVCARCDLNKKSMPKKLTAENGAKALLSGEFYENFEMQCPQCGGAGSIVDEFEFGDEEISCDYCDGYGEYTVRVPVSWTTIKEIYKKIVEDYSSEQGNSSTNK
jgi:DnaJ-class molecular chaperone